MARMRACGRGLRRMRPSSIRGSTTSPVNLARPVTLSTPSTRGRSRPTYAKRRLRHGSSDLAAAGRTYLRSPAAPPLDTAVMERLPRGCSGRLLAPPPVMEAMVATCARETSPISDITSQRTDSEHGGVVREPMVCVVAEGPRQERGGAQGRRSIAGFVGPGRSVDDGLDGGVGGSRAMQDAHDRNFTGRPHVHQVHLQGKGLAVDAMFARIVKVDVVQPVFVAVQSEPALSAVLDPDEASRVGDTQRIRAVQERNGRSVALDVPGYVPPGTARPLRRKADSRPTALPSSPALRHRSSPTGRVIGFSVHASCTLPPNLPDAGGTIGLRW